jgi:hypothetical protein
MIQNHTKQREKLLTYKPCNINILGVFSVLESRSDCKDFAMNNNYNFLNLLLH